MGQFSVAQVGQFCTAANSVQVERFAEVHQFNRTFSLNAVENTHPHLQGQLKSFVEFVSSSGQTLVVSTKKVRCLLTGETEVGLPQIGTLGGASIIHFQKLRGLNDFKDYDNVIIIGREQPPAAAMESMAKAIWWDEDEPLRLITDQEKNSYVKERRGYRMRSGSPESAETYVHPDRRVQSLLEQVRESEVTQAVDRLRLVREKTVQTDQGPQKVTRRVFLLTSIPVDITVDHLWDWDRLQEFFSLWEKTGGVLPLGRRELLPILSGVESIEGAKKVAARLIGVRSLINNLISVKDPFSLFSYKLDPSAPGQPAKAIIADRHPDPKAALEELLGHPVGFLEAIDS